MKKIILPLTICALWGTALHAQDALPGSVSNVTFALTFTDTAPGTVEKDGTGKVIKGGGPDFWNEYTVTNTTKKTEERTYEYVSKIKTVKFGNKELLLKLIENGILSKYGQSPFIAGWAIVYVTASVTDEEGDTDETPGKYYAVHKGEEDIVDLSDHIESDYGQDFAEKGTYKEVTKINNANPEIPVVTKVITSAFNWKETLYFRLNFQNPVATATGHSVLEENDYAEFQGISTAGNKLTTVGSAKAPVIVENAGKVSAISGQGPHAGDPEETDRAVVEGSVSFAAGKADADVSRFPNIRPLIEIQ